MLIYVVSVLSFLIAGNAINPDHTNTNSVNSSIIRQVLFNQ